MISTKALFNRNAKQTVELAMQQPAEPVTIEGEALAHDISEYLSKATAEQRALLGESDELGRQMAELLASKELGQPVDPESVISVAERRATVRQHLEAVEYRIAGLQAQQDALQATENERRCDALRPQLEKSGELGEALLHQWYLVKCQESEILDAINANAAHFRSLTADWNRASSGLIGQPGHGVSNPRDMWDFYLPEVRRQATYPNPEGRRTLAQQIEHVLYIDPQQRREQMQRDHEKQAANEIERKRAEQQPYLSYLKSKRIAEREGRTIEPWKGPIPSGMKNVQSDLDWEG